MTNFVYSSDYDVIVQDRVDFNYLNFKYKMP